MKTHKVLYIGLMIASIILAACGPSQADLQAKGTQDAASLFATQTASAPTDTSTPKPTETPTATLVPTETSTPTATPDVSATAAAATSAARQATQQANQTATAVAAAATQKAEDDFWAQMVSDGSITYTRGELFDVDDFEESWAQRDWYTWWWFGYNLSDFVISTHIQWEIPEDSAFYDGGCGFVIRLKDENTHLVVFLNPRGDAELGAMSTSGFQYQGTHWQNPDLPSFANVTPATTGSADFTVVAEKEFVTVYVDGVRYYQWYVALTNSGDIGYTIVSGTNKDFGTYCNFSNTRIWELVK